MSRFLFTFTFLNAAKVLNTSDDGEEPFVSVFASTYQRAVKKILKLNLPHVESEEDLKFLSCSEELEIDDDETQTT